MDAAWYDFGDWTINSCAESMDTTFMLETAQFELGFNIEHSIEFGLELDIK